MNEHTHSFGGVPLSQNLSNMCTRMLGAVAQAELSSPLGRVLQLSADSITAEVDNCSIGDMCSVVERSNGKTVECQVVSIDGDKTILSPITPIDGLSTNCDVIASRKQFTVNVGDHLIGRVIDGMGKPLDHSNNHIVGTEVPVKGQWLSPLERTVIDEQFVTGIRSLDLFNTVGVGQRLAVLGEPGAGKSTLISMLARHCEADVVVISMIGERGREVREFLDRQLPPKIRNRCVTVVSTSDRPALERVMAAHTAMSISEDFRKRGKNVLLLFDSVTRFSRALREVGLAAGEKPVRQGYTPSVYTELPKLLERCGKTKNGSITGFFTVLLENEGVNDAISEEVISLTDGHIKLDAKLAATGHYPAVDILKSKSRLMNELASRELLNQSSIIRKLIAKYQEVELLVQVGEYVAGSDREADAAIAARAGIRALCVQALEEQISPTHALKQLNAVLNGLKTDKNRAA